MTIKRIFLILTVVMSAGCRRVDQRALRAPSADYPPLPGLFQDIGPRWSPNGRRVAFLRRTPDRRQQLCLSDPNLGSVEPMLEPELASPDRLINPSYRRYISPETLAWSPDGRRIAFPREEWFKFDDGDVLPGTGLWSIDTASGRVMPMGLHPPDYKKGYYFYRFPQWSPDGRYFSYIGEGINGQRLVFVRALKAQRAEEVPPRFDNYEDSDWAAWMPRTDSDNTDPAYPKSKIKSRKYPTLIYRQGVHRTSASPRTETLRTLRPGSATGPLSGTVWKMRAFDYARLLAQRPDAKRRALENPLALVRYPVPGTPRLEVVAPRAGHLVYSPSGKTLAFTLTPDANAFDRYEIWLLDLATGKARCVRPANEQGYIAPVWIGEDRLGALSPNGDRFTVVIININSGRTRTVGTIDSADCDWSPDRRVIVYASAPAEAQQETTLRLLYTGVSAW